MIQFTLWFTSAIVSSLLAMNIVAQDMPVPPKILGAFAQQETILSNTAAEIPMPTPATQPVAKNGTQTLQVLGTSAIVLDRDSYSILFEKEAYEPKSPASTTKIFTAIAVLQHLPGDQKVTVPLDLHKTVGGSWMGLLPGDIITVENLLWGMLLNSGNDAVYALSKSYPGGITSLLADMNNLAKNRGLRNTHLANPYGFTEYTHYATAFDLATFADYALQDPVFANMVKTKSKTVRSLNKSHALINTNTLLGQVQGIKGVKTGWTQEAQGVLVTATERNGREIITVVMDSPNREEDTKRLIEWSFANYTW